LLLDLGRSAALSGLLAAPVLASLFHAPLAAARVPAAPDLAPINQLDLQVNSYTTSNQQSTALAHDAAGNMVVVWQSSGSAGTDTDLTSIQAQLFNSMGTPVGTEFQVNSLTTGGNLRPDVAMDDAGNFVVVWHNTTAVGADTSGDSVWGRQFDNSGTAQGVEFELNTYTTGDQSDAAVAMDADGDFVALWESAGSAGSDTDQSSIQAQQFNSDGSAQGAEFQVNSYTTGDQQQGDLAIDSSGNFVVVWTSSGSPGSDSDGTSVQVQRYDNQGSTLGAQVQINSYTTSSQSYASVALDEDGDFVASWESFGSYGTDSANVSVQAQRFNSLGSAQGGQFQVNTYTTSKQRTPSVSSDTGGSFMITWDSDGSFGTDAVGPVQHSAGGGNYSIQGRQFSPTGDPQGGEFQINAYVTDNQTLPQITNNAPGLFAVVWTSRGSFGTDSDGESTQFKLLDPAAEFQVNTYTTSHQRAPDVAVDANGNYVITWASFGSDGTDTVFWSIQAQRYDSFGIPVGQQFQVNTYTDHIQHQPAVAMDADGHFVVAWHSMGSAGTDSDGYSIQGQRFNSLGTAQGSEFQVNTYTSSTQRNADVAVDSDGDYVIVWDSYGSLGTDSSLSSIQGQRYNSMGTAQGGEFQVNTYTASAQRSPAVGMDAAGNFAVTWDSLGSNGTDTGWSIQGQRYDAAGAIQGSEFQVNSYTTADQREPDLAMHADGDFIIVWHSDGSYGSDTATFSIQGQRYKADGTTIASQFQVNTYTTNSQRAPAVALDEDGDFVVSWHSWGSPGGDSEVDSIQVQRLRANGTLIGGQVQANQYTTNYQEYPAVAMDADGNFITTWTSSGSFGTDQDSYSVAARRFERVEPIYLPIIQRP
jgi:hypothetical protein